MSKYNNEQGEFDEDIDSAVGCAIWLVIILAAIFLFHLLIN